MPSISTSESQTSALKKCEKPTQAQTPPFMTASGSMAGFVSDIVSEIL
jgi:hypothetical protein